MHGWTGTSRRQVMGMAAAVVGSAMTGGAHYTWAQTNKKIEQLAPELDKIISVSEPIKELVV